jgi:hypothetical protein
MKSTVSVTKLNIRNEVSRTLEVRMSPLGHSGMQVVAVGAPLVALQRPPKRAPASRSHTGSWSLGTCAFDETRHRFARNRESAEEGVA